MPDRLENLERRMDAMAVALAQKLAANIRDKDTLSGAFLSAGRLFLSSMGRLRDVKDAIADAHMEGPAEVEATRRRDASLPGFGGAQQRVKLR